MFSTLGIKAWGSRKKLCTAIDSLRPQETPEPLVPREMPRASVSDKIPSLPDVIAHFEAQIETLQKKLNDEVGRRRKLEETVRRLEEDVGGLRSSNSRKQRHTPEVSKPSSAPTTPVTSSSVQTEPFLGAARSLSGGSLPEMSEVEGDVSDTTTTSEHASSNPIMQQVPPGVGGSGMFPVAYGPGMQVMYDNMHTMQPQYPYPVNQPMMVPYPDTGFPVEMRQGMYYVAPGMEGMYPGPPLYTGGQFEQTPPEMETAQPTTT
mmetsp:Transcript_21277/g.46307  ORF Transcript_21277/g.46307 Transcript_21277/m.46307 type:complete len:262 (-) Transcript_21277:271-1056(-)